MISDLIVDFNPTMYSVTEVEQIELMVVLNRPSDHDVTVQLTTSDGIATGLNTINIALISLLYNYIQMHSQLIVYIIIHPQLPETTHLPQLPSPSLPVQLCKQCLFQQLMMTLMSN